MPGDGAGSRSVSGGGGGGGPVEGDVARQHLVEQDAGGVDVGPAVGVGLAARLLGRRVVRLGRLVGRPSHPEAREADDAVGAHDDGVGAETPVDEAAGRGVPEGEEDGPQRLERLALVEGALAGDLLLERGAFGKLGGKVAGAPGLADLDPSDDVRMVEPHRGPRAAQEALAGLIVAGEVGRQDLQRDLLARVDLSGREHRAAPALAQAFQHLEAADAGRIGIVVRRATPRHHRFPLCAAFRPIIQRLAGICKRSAAPEHGPR